MPNNFVEDREVIRRLWKKLFPRQSEAKYWDFIIDVIPLHVLEKQQYSLSSLYLGYNFFHRRWITLRSSTMLFSI